MSQIYIMPNTVPTTNYAMGGRDRRTIPFNTIKGRMAKSAVAFNEACWDGSHTANSKLLSTITEADYITDPMLCERKHRQPRQLSQFLNFLNTPVSKL